MSPSAGYGTTSKRRGRSSACSRAPRPPCGVPARNTRVVEVSLASAGLKDTTTIRIPSDEEPRSADTPLAAFAEQIEQAALRFDRPGLERAFGRAVGLYSLRQDFNQALAPALTRVGQRYLEDLGDVASEHFLTAFAREKLLGAPARLALPPLRVADALRAPLVGAPLAIGPRPDEQRRDGVHQPEAGLLELESLG